MIIASSTFDLNNDCRSVILIKNRIVQNQKINKQ